jgi:acetoin utilization deacetylase AcuC-like enzyme
MSTTNRTGYLYHEIYAWHDTGSGPMMPSNAFGGIQPFVHMENAETKRRMHELIVVSGLIDHLFRIDPVRATEDDILRCHTREHLAYIQAGSELPKGGDAGDGVSPYGHGGYDIAMMAAGGIMKLADEVISGTIRNGYALVRPPGHHATSTMGMGFCMFNNIAIAARHLQATRGVGRVAIVDWDVHHGNGTQEIFYNDPSVLTISLHQDNCFPPNSGLVTENGEGKGAGYALNVPLPPGSGNPAYELAMTEVVVPAIRAFDPDIILVSSGFDASLMDPLARQMITTSGYRRMTEILMDLADDVCSGRLAMSHEGGYNPVYVPFCGLAVMEQLSGVKVLDDPFGAFDYMADFPLLDHQKAVVTASAALAGKVGA